MLEEVRVDSSMRARSSALRCWLALRRLVTWAWSGVGEGMGPVGGAASLLWGVVGDWGGWFIVQEGLREKTSEKVPYL